MLLVWKGSETSHHLGDKRQNFHTLFHAMVFPSNSDTIHILFVIKTVYEEKDLCIFDLKPSLHCQRAAATWLDQENLLLCISVDIFSSYTKCMHVYVRSHLAWCPYLAKEIDLLEKVHNNVLLSCYQTYSTCHMTLSLLHRWHAEERFNWDLCKILYGVDPAKFFTFSSRGHQFKLIKSRLQLLVRQNFFTYSYTGIPYLVMWFLHLQ